jgi:hypothetical protein
MPLDRLWRFLGDVLLRRRRRRGRRLTRRDRRLGLGWRRLGRRGLRRRGFGRRRFDRNHRRLGRWWNRFRLRLRRRRSLWFWRRRFENDLDPALRNRLRQWRRLFGEKQHQQRQADRVPGKRYRKRKLDAAHFGLAASATKDTFENPA